MTSCAYQYWKGIQPPIRPSENVLKYIFPKIPQGSNVLILGSTPEYRRLCHVKNCKVTVVDESLDIYNNMTPLVKHKGKELFIQKKWQLIHFIQEFDIILADGSLNMLSFDEVPIIIKNIQHALKPQGCFLLRIQYQHPSKFPDVKSIIRHWREKELGHIFTNTYIDLFNLRASKEGVFQNHSLGDVSRELLQNNYINIEESIVLDLSKHMISIYAHHEPLFNALCMKYFTLIEKFEPPDYANAYCWPVLLFKNRMKHDE